MLMILMIILLFSSFFIVRSEAQGIGDDVDNVTAHDSGIDFDKIADIDHWQNDHVDDTHLSPQCKSGTPLCQRNTHLINTMLVWWSFYFVQTFWLESDLEY